VSGIGVLIQKAPQTLYNGRSRCCFAYSPMHTQAFQTFASNSRTRVFTKRALLPHFSLSYNNARATTRLPRKHETVFGRKLLTRCVSDWMTHHGPRACGMLIDPLCLPPGAPSLNSNVRVEYVVAMDLNMVSLLGALRIKGPLIRPC